MAQHASESRKTSNMDPAPARHVDDVFCPRSRTARDNRIRAEEAPPDVRSVPGGNSPSDYPASVRRAANKDSPACRSQKSINMPKAYIRPDLSRQVGAGPVAVQIQASTAKGGTAGVTANRSCLRPRHCGSLWLTSARKCDSLWVSMGLGIKSIPKSAQVRRKVLLRLAEMIRVGTGPCVWVMAW